MPEPRRRATRPTAARPPRNRWRDWPPWIDRLSNWQFVAVLASFFILCYAAYAGISDLAGSHVNLRYTIPGDVLGTIAFTAVAAWKRWK